MTSSILPYNEGLPVYLNIYDVTLLNNILHPLGLGAYHTSIQLFDTEFSFYPKSNDQTGVQEESKIIGLKFRKKIKLGECFLKYNEIEEIINDLKGQFIASSYDTFEKNCNHFTNEFSKKIFNREIPNFINRLPKVTKIFRCFLTKKFLYGGVERVEKSKHRKNDNGNLAKLKKKNSNNEKLKLNENIKDSNESSSVGNPSTNEASINQ